MQRLVIACLLVAGAASAQAPLLVVDAAGGPGSQYTGIAEAIAAAPHGAVTVLVRAGTYEPFVVDGRSLIVVAAAGADVIVGNSTDPTVVPVAVRHIAPTDVVILEGLSVVADQGDAIRIENCGGQVWLQDCTAIYGGYFGPKRASVRVFESDQVLLVRCVLGKDGWGNGEGLRAMQSRVFAYESKLYGGNGFQSSPSQPSAPGARVEGGLLFAEDTRIQGATGTSYLTFPGEFCQVDFYAGPGLKLEDQAHAILLDTDPVGGEMSGCSGVDGPDLFIEDGSTLEELDGPSASFAVDSPSIDGVPTTLHVVGSPGDVPLVLMATALTPATYFGKYKGMLCAGNPFFVVLAPLPASGKLDVAFDLGDALPPGTGSTIFMQGAMLKAAGGGLLADPATLTTIDD